jgi:hypothetical protein
MAEKPMTPMERAILAERIRIVLSIGPNEMFPLTVRLAPPPESETPTQQQQQG